MMLLLWFLPWRYSNDWLQSLRMDFFSCCAPCQEESKPIKRKVVLLGSSRVGKSCLLLRLLGQSLPARHVTTILDLVRLDVQVDRHKVSLEVWDTPGTEELDRLRPLSFPDTDVVLLCFSLDSRSSLDSLHDFWFPVIRHFFAGVPVVLVGTKADIRVPPETPEGAALKKAIRRMVKAENVAFYRETSAKADKNVRKLFFEAVKMTLSKCCRPKRFKSYRNKEERTSPLSVYRVRAAYVHF